MLALPSGRGLDPQRGLTRYAPMIRAPLLLSVVLLGGCVPVVVPVPLPAPVAQPKPKTELLGREPQQVTALLGSPSFDRSEGPARQLQFKNGACVLDVFFYPDHKSGRVTATHVEARTPAGQAYDAAACTEALAARG